MDSVTSAWRPIALCGALLAGSLGLEHLDPFPEDRIHIQASPHNLPSTRAVPPLAVAQGTELLSMVIDEHALTGSERGLLTHPEARGREWERAAYVSFFTDGRLRLATRAGVRLHGGRSRLYSKTKSFRLYFRPKYGPPAVPSDLLFGATDLRNEVTRVIVHNDVRHDRARREWHLVNPLAYDIAARLGAIVPRTRPIRFYLNGEPQGVYVLTEHISPEFLEARFGHRNFSIDEDRRGLLRWAMEARPLTMGVAGGAVDLDNVTSWALTVLFCATTDIAGQGAMVRNSNDPNAPSFFVTWDLDHSFMDLYQSAPAPWLLDSYRNILGNAEGRSFILTRLLRNDRNYRRYFAQRLAAALNHQLTPAFLSGRLAHYREAAVQRGVTDLRYIEIIERFFAERPPVLWRLTAALLKTPPPVIVTVTGRPGLPVTIDGFAATLPYTGTYLPGTPFVLEAADGLTRWIVDGRPHADARVAVEITRDLRIQAAVHTAEAQPR